MAKFGFLNLGYNEDGFNKAGFDRNGFNKDGYNKYGFDKNGYNKSGYDKYGYDREGFDVNGFTKDGFNHDGFNKEGYNKEGFNRLGFNKNGFNHDGFNAEGFDKYGFSKDGFNKASFDRNGFNRDGFDAFGYDKNGFNSIGYNKFGFDKDGYNTFGIDKYGYDRKGYNHEGFDREGYNKNGYNKEGFNKEGYDKDGFNKLGFNKDGFNKQGYDKNGYDINGFDKNGINSLGINIWGYDKSWLNECGFSPIGFNSSGYDIEGYNKNGFSADGYDKEGNFYTDFDEDGYHLKTGFNRFGFNKQGVNINGINENGEKIFSNKNENVIGYDENGFPHNSFNLSSFILKKEVTSTDKKSTNNLFGYDIGDYIYHINLGKAKIISLQGPYCDVVFESTGKKMTFNIHSDWISSKPTKKVEDMLSNMNESILLHEKDYLSKKIVSLKKYCENSLRDKINSEFNEKYKDYTYSYTDSSGIYHEKPLNYNAEIEEEYEKISYSLIDSPYFAKVEKNGDVFYIGKIGAEDIVDWQSTKCKYYYQYQVYMSIPSENLTLIRDLEISKSELFGYVDKYNSNLSDNETKKYADEHLRKIIQTNRDNKNIHDIISSIQKNQYEIITQDKDVSMIVLGCAGSGKTMIMLHRISYLLYNNIDLSAKNIYVLSPTHYLSFESNILSKTLNLKDVNKFTFNEMFIEIIKQYSKKFGINLYLLKNQKILSSCKTNNCDYYKDSNAEQHICKILSIITKGSKNNLDFIKEYSSLLSNNIDKFYKAFSNKETFLRNYNIFVKFRHDCKNANVGSRKNEKGYSLLDVNNMLHIAKQECQTLEKLYKLRSLLNYFVNNKCCLGTIKTEFPSQIQIDTIFEKFDYLNLLIDNYSLLEDKLDIYFDDKTNAIDVLIKELFIRKKISKKESFISIYEGLRTSENDFTLKIIRYIEDYIKTHSNIVNIVGILEYLSKKQNLFANHREEYETPSYTKFLNGIYDVFKSMNFNYDNYSVSSNYAIFDDINGVFDFFEKYELLISKNEILEKFKNGDYINILSEIVLSSISADYRIDKINYFTNDYELYYYALICFKLFGALNNESKLIYIDEFQDLSTGEIALLKNIYPEAIFNFYGDYNQCINPKGLKDENELTNLFKGIKQYKINENYRNAYEITSYINKIMDMQMMPVGISGQVINISYYDFSKLKFTSNDRIAYIVKDFSSLNYNFMEKIGIIEGWKGKQATEIPSEIPVALTIQDVKGLEFEDVIVDDINMSDNEKYVAYTRALNRLYIIK